MKRNTLLKIARNVSGFLLSAAMLLVLAFPCNGQSVEDAVQWSAKVSPDTAQPGGRAEMGVKAKIADGWHVYSTDQKPGGPKATVIRVPDGQVFHAANSLIGPVPRTAFDSNFQMETRFYEGLATFKIPLTVAANAPVGVQKAQVSVFFQVCNEQLCLPPTKLMLEAAVNITSTRTPKQHFSGSPPAQRAGPVGSNKLPPVNADNPPASAIASVDGSVESAARPQPDTSVVEPKAAALSPHPPGTVSPAQDTSLGAFIALALGMGALSLLTPCVFPMIPITVSYFANHSANTRGGALRNAAIYSLGIILTFTAVGIALALLFGVAGVNQLAANPWVNLLITAIFIGFALSLFGAYFVQVPPRLLSWLDHISRERANGQYLGALLMGFTFTLTSFTCTSPFVGTLLVGASHGNWQWPVLGMLCFSTMFAMPFFLLALAPQLLSQLPRSGGWMNSVKVVMGFMEIAAAMKFLSNADLVWNWGIFTRQVVLAVWVATGILTVTYLLGKFQMSHDTQLSSVSAARAVIAIIFLSVSVWLGTGLLGRSLGEIESFLPPPEDSAPGSTSAVAGNLAHDELSWVLNDLPAAMIEAKQENKAVFIDFTGYTCTNCRWMEANMFPRPEVKEQLNRFVRARLYTDGSGMLFEDQQTMEKERFGTVALPLYAILNPDGQAVATFAGLTRKPERFLSFLQQYRDSNSH